MKWKNGVIRAVQRIAKVFGRSYYLTQFARLIVKYYDNDGNGNMATNGEIRVQTIISAFSKKESNVIDVGANVGDWSENWLKLSPKGKLYVIDPLERNIEIARQKLSTHCESEQQVYFEQCALSNNIASTSFYTNNDERLSGHDSLMDMGLIGYRESTTCIEVDTLTLDSLSLKIGLLEILFLKIDTEGSEFKILQGAKELLRQEAIEFIQIEFGHAARADRVFLHDIVNLMSQYNYSIFIIKPNGLAPLNFSPFTENRYSYINLLMVRRASLQKIRCEIIES
jgi:FkbM family methyltransferase